MAPGTTTSTPPAHALAAALLRRIKHWPDGIRRGSLAAVDFSATYAVALCIHVSTGGGWAAAVSSAFTWAGAVVLVMGAMRCYALRPLPAPRIGAAAIAGSLLAAVLGAWPEPMIGVPPVAIGLGCLLVASRRGGIRLFRHPLARRRVLLVGTSEEAMALGEALRGQPAAGLQVLGLLTDLPRLPARTGMLVLGPPHHAALVLERWGADGIVLGEAAHACGRLPAGTVTWKLDDVLGRLGYSACRAPSTSRWRSKIRRFAPPRAW